MSKTISARAEWLPYLQKHCVKSSCKDGSLLELRRSAWGKNAYVVRCNKYLFMVSESIFNYVEAEKEEA